MPPDGFSRKLNTPSSLPSGGVTVMVNFTCTALPLAVTSVLSGVMVSVAVSSAHAGAAVPSSSITLRMAQISLRTHIPLSFSHHIPLRRLCQPHPCRKCVNSGAKCTAKRQLIHPSYETRLCAMAVRSAALMMPSLFTSMAADLSVVMPAA